MQARTDLGVDIIKIAVSELFYSVSFWDEIAKLINAGVKVIAVFFANEHLDFSLLATLAKAGFYGAMLDTQTKQQNLLQLQTKHTLQMFTQNCREYHLKSGLAGSLQPQHIANLTEWCVQKFNTKLCAM
jgi:(5-formylfuran-3-yl)methyl phosphate synthase